MRAGSGPSAGGGAELAFLGRPWSSDPLADARGSEFVVSVTSGQDDAQGLLDRTLPEEEGGPFVETTEGVELAYD